MTIAIALKIGDGLILGSDSAVTLSNPGSYPDNIYVNAEKIINLVKGLPLGAVTYGLGGFSGRSITRLAKDLRKRFSDPGHPWWVDPEAYSVEDVAIRVKEFFYDEHYRAAYPEGGEGTAFGFIIAGYGPDAAHGEVWTFDVEDTAICYGPIDAITTRDGLIYRGQEEALNRLLRGWSSDAVQRLTSKEMPALQVLQTLDSIAPLWSAAMPIQDGIDVVRYLIEVTAGFVRYSAKPTTVAPPTDLAAITLHEGFRWISRKHYYDPALNQSPQVRCHTFDAGSFDAR